MFEIYERSFSIVGEERFDIGRFFPPSTKKERKTKVAPCFRISSLRDARNNAGTRAMTGSYFTSPITAILSETNLPTLQVGTWQGINPKVRNV